MDGLVEGEVDPLADSEPQSKLLPNPCLFERKHELRDLVRPRPRKGQLS
jgi:hypothetical protein